MLHRSSLVLAFAFVFAAACGPSHPSDDTADDTPPDAHGGPYVSISVTPTNPILELDLGVTGSQAFQAFGVFEDGVREDISSQVTWELMNPAAGTMVGATLFTPAFVSSAAVTSKLTATLDDLTGLAQVTIVAYRQSGPQQDFFFILPYQDPHGETTKPLEFSTEIPALDAFFLMDTTGSMGGEISNLQSGISSVVIPGIQASVPDSEFGVGAMEDFPLDPYGSSVCSSTGADQPFKLLQPITGNTPIVQAGVIGLSDGPGGAPIGCGNDIPEAGLESIYQVATGEGLSSPAPTNVPANHSGIGGVGFRPGTMPVVIAITDALSHGAGETATCSSTGDATAYTGAVGAAAHTRQQTKDALNGICARVVGIAAIPSFVDLDCTGQAYLEDLATATGARVAPSAWDVGTRPPGCAATQCCTDVNGVGRAPDGDGLCPVVFRVNESGSGLGASVVTGIQMLTRFATFDASDTTTGVDTDVDGNPLPVPHTTADFIKSIVPTNFEVPTPPPIIPPPTFDTTQFYGVTPGTTIGFDVNAFNDFIEQTDEGQFFRANIQVLASGCTPLDQRDVFILVPPIPIVVE
jgi:hypothetical protein